MKHANTKLTELQISQDAETEVQICFLDEGHCRGIENFGGRMKRGWEVDTSVSRKCPVVDFGVDYHCPVNNSLKEQY